MSLSDSIELRSILSILYTIVEVLRVPVAGEDAEFADCREQLRQELSKSNPWPFVLLLPLL